MPSSALCLHDTHYLIYLIAVLHLLVSCVFCEWNMSLMKAGTWFLPLLFTQYHQHCLELSTQYGLRELTSTGLCQHLIFKCKEWYCLCIDLAYILESLAPSVPLHSDPHRKATQVFHSLGRYPRWVFNVGIHLTLYCVPHQSALTPWPSNMLSPFPSQNLCFPVSLSRIFSLHFLIYWLFPVFHFLAQMSPHQRGLSWSPNQNYFHPSISYFLSHYSTSILL